MWFLKPVIYKKYTLKIVLTSYIFYYIKGFAKVLRINQTRHFLWMSWGPWQLQKYLVTTSSMQLWHILEPAWFSSASSFKKEEGWGLLWEVRGTLRYTYIFAFMNTFVLMNNSTELTPTLSLNHNIHKYYYLIMFRDKIIKVSIKIYQGTRTD